MNQKKVIYIDMDGVLVDFEAEIHRWVLQHPHLENRYKDNPDHIHGIFRNPNPISGSIEAVKQLYESGKYEMFIATAAPWGNPEAATDKRYWIEKYFGNIFHKKMFVTHRKDLLMGDYLIDDRTANGAGEFKGELISFGWNYEEQKFNKYPNWDSVLQKLL
jgi:5'(3')-deoxyribonucleotidase